MSALGSAAFSSLPSASSTSSSSSASAASSSAASPSAKFDASPLFLLVLAVGLIAGIALSTVALKRHRARPPIPATPYVPPPLVRPRLWEFAVVPVPSPGSAGRASGTLKGRWQDLLPLSARLLDEPAPCTEATRAQDLHARPRPYRSPLAWLRDVLLTALYGPDSRIHRDPYAVPPGILMVPLPPQSQQQQHLQPPLGAQGGETRLQVAVAIAMPGAVLPRAPQEGKASAYEELFDGELEFCVGLADLPWADTHNLGALGRASEEGQRGTDEG